MFEPLTRPLRCAVYTRKSSEEGLEQAFNSLHAQREACEAFVKSQQHEGWVLEPTPYDDGAYSGGNLQRPALQALMAEIKAGRIDIVVVYKVDRLTRSLADFAKIVDILDSAKASFVSVTQAFNTTTSMGRLTLNVLLSFAQFEREVTGERIRDKIAASKKKGMWMGGLAPLGYDAVDRKLVVNATEAATVRTLFDRFVALGSVDRLVADAAGLGLTTKRRTAANGVTGDQPFSRGTLYHLLENRTYLGEVVHRDETFPGDHDAIVDVDVFDQVQKLISLNRRTRKAGRNSPRPSLLAGLLVDEQGRRFTPTHTQKAGKRYHYYIMAADGAEPAYRLPAEEVEEAVALAMTEFLSSPGEVLQAARINEADQAAQMLGRVKAQAMVWAGGSATERRQMAVDQLVAVVHHDDGLTLKFRPLASGDGSSQSLDRRIGARIARRGATLRLVVDNGKPRPDQKLLSLIATGESWFQQLIDGRAATLAELAAENGCTPTYVRRVIEAGFLSPTLKTAISQGVHPPALTIEALRRGGSLPLAWNEHLKHLVG